MASATLAMSISPASDAALTILLQQLEMHAGPVGTPTASRISSYELTIAALAAVFHVPRLSGRLQLGKPDQHNARARADTMAGNAKKPRVYVGTGATRRTPNRGSREQWRVCVRPLHEANGSFFGPIGKRPVGNCRNSCYKCCRFSHALGQVFRSPDVLAQLTENVAAVLDVSGTGVSILDEQNQLRFVTASSDALIVAEEQQEQLQQGPCIDASQLSGCSCGGVMPTSSGRRVPPGCSGPASVSSVVTDPAGVEDRCLGSLNIYDERARQWTEADVRIGTVVLADMAVGYVINASQLEQAEERRSRCRRRSRTGSSSSRRRASWRTRTASRSTRRSPSYVATLATSRSTCASAAAAVVQSGLQIHAVDPDGVSALFLSR